MTVKNKKAPAKKLEPSVVEAFEASIRTWRERLGLFDWDIRVKSKAQKDLTEKDARALAWCICTYGQRMATIFINVPALTEEPECIDLTALHELLHVVTDPLFCLAMRDASLDTVRAADHQVVVRMVNAFKQAYAGK